MAEDQDRFKFLHKEATKCAAVLGVPESIVIDVYLADSDWEFILKIDALLEAASKEVVKKSLEGAKKIAPQVLDDFVDALPLRGRTSLLALLEGTGCDREEIELIDCVRKMRNGFAHDIRQTGASLIEVIKGRSDKAALLRGLSSIRKFNEAELIKMYEKDGKFLRYGILDGTLRFLTLAYHNVLKP